MKANAVLPTVYFLIGPPGSGKSTWRTRFTNLAENCHRAVVVVSTDDLIEEWATARGMNYSEAFTHKEFKFSMVEKQMMETYRNALRDGADVIVDRTNMRRKSRASFLNNIPSGYRTYAVVFEVDRPELNRRLEARALETGKRIPSFVVDDMLKNYEPPTLAEFDFITKV